MKLTDSIILIMNNQISMIQAVGSEMLYIAQLFQGSCSLAYVIEEYRRQRTPKNTNTSKNIKD